MSDGVPQLTKKGSIRGEKLDTKARWFAVQRKVCLLRVYVSAFVLLFAARKTYTKWINARLNEANLSQEEQIKDVLTDLDGERLKFSFESQSCRLLSLSIQTVLF